MIETKLFITDPFVGVPFIERYKKAFQTSQVVINEKDQLLCGLSDEYWPLVLSLKWREYWTI